MAEINIGCRLVWGDVFLALRLVDLGAGAVGLGIGSDWLGGVFLPPLQDSRTPEYVLQSMRLWVILLGKALCIT